MISAWVDVAGRGDPVAIFLSFRRHVIEPAEHDSADGTPAVRLQLAHRYAAFVVQAQEGSVVARTVVALRSRSPHHADRLTEVRPEARP
jgi:uncharacterized protein (UPF0262 family)